MFASGLGYGEVMRSSLVLGVFLVVCFVGTCHEAAEWRASLPSNGCKPEPGPVLVRVSPATVSYARRQGWPRVLVRGGTATGDVLAYDSGRVARRVRSAVEDLCVGQRFRLVAAHP
jgi:hypothetical protein